MSLLLAIDPGNRLSAYVVYDAGKVLGFAKLPNSELLDFIDREHDPERALGIGDVVIEQVACMGMAVGEEVFETCVWTGRFWEAADRASMHVHRIKRGQIKLHLCGNMRAKDPNIRQALIDRFGGSEAIGRKKTPGPLYGVSGDVWAALAVAVTWADTSAKTEQAA